MTGWTRYLLWVLGCALYIWLVVTLMQSAGCTMADPC